MDNQYIAVMDSGIGGISVLTELIKNFPNQNFLYFGDNDNAPYGNRSKQDLLNLAIHNSFSLQYAKCKLNKANKRIFKLKNFWRFSTS